MRPLLVWLGPFCAYPRAEALAHSCGFLPGPAAAQRDVAALCPAFGAPFLSTWKARATRQTQRHSPSRSALLRPAMGSPVHRAQIPPSWWHPRTQQQASEMRLLAPVCKSSPACCSSQTSRGTFHTEDSGHVNSPPVLLLT